MGPLYPSAMAPETAPETAPSALDEYAEQNDLELTRMNGFDDCIAGLVNRFGQPTIVCYDLQKVLAKLQADGMTREEAEEWFEFNMIGAWVGEGTPCFLDTTSLATCAPPAPAAS